MDNYEGSEKPPQLVSLEKSRPDLVNSSYYIDTGDPPGDMVAGRLDDEGLESNMEEALTSVRDFCNNDK